MNDNAAVNQKLGILLNSLEYADQVIELARAAHAKGKGVRIHLSLQGVYLMQDEAFDELRRIAVITACRESIDVLGLPENIGENARDLLVESSQLSRLLADCSRCVAF